MDTTNRAVTSTWFEVKSALKQDKLIYCYSLVILLSLYLFTKYTSSQLTIDYNMFIYTKSLIKVVYISFIAWSSYCYIHLLINRTRHPFLAYLSQLRNAFLPLSKAISFIMLIIIISFIFSCYTYFKSIIPDITPFYLDTYFYDIDKWLHFGVSPWELTHALFNSHLSTFFLNFLYHLWFILIWGTTIYFVVSRSQKTLRTQYLLSFLICWTLIGNVFATLLSSAGPCYLHLIDHSQTNYLPLIDILRTQSRALTEIGLPPLWALDLQDSLWLRYVDRQGGVGAGISAMPSMHVAISVLLALSLYRKNKLLGYILWVYSIFIQIGSVHLAWHYAIDGYVSAILTILIWKSVGRLLNKL